MDGEDSESRGRYVFTLIVVESNELSPSKL
jgi:hypothetical protein